MSFLSYCCCLCSFLFFNLTVVTGGQRLKRKSTWRLILGTQKLRRSWGIWNCSLVSPTLWWLRLTCTPLLTSQAAPSAGDAHSWTWSKNILSLWECVCLLFLNVWIFLNKRFTFCLSRFGWSSRKTEETLQPVIKQLNTQQVTRLHPHVSMSKQQ